MSFPAFFDAVPRFKMRDPLAEFLGAAEGGVLEYAYVDVVKLAGHSCPTVAAAYVLGCRALVALYPDSIPERGGMCASNWLMRSITASPASPPACWPCSPAPRVRQVLKR